MMRWTRLFFCADLSLSQTRAAYKRGSEIVSSQQEIDLLFFRFSFPVRVK